MSRLSSDRTTSAETVVSMDLEYICSNLREEFGLLAGKHLLLTGGAGFLGYYLIQAILCWNGSVDERERIRLTVSDNYARGMPQWLTKLKDDSNLNLVEHDITLPLPRNVPDFEYIMHAASVASPTFYRKSPITTMDANVKGLRNLLEYFRAQKDANKPIGGFLFFSSSEIYGDPSPENIPTPEEYRGNVSCTGPRACYDEAKRYGETLCANFAGYYGLPVKMVRPFNNYGPGLRISDGRVLSDFARDTFAGRDIVMLSNGSPTRTFCYVADAVVGYYKVLVRGRVGEAYNIGVEAPEISIADLAERLVSVAREVLGYSGKVIRQASPDQDYLVDSPNRRCPRIGKARAHLGFNPTISLDEGLRRLLIWYSQNREVEKG